MKTHLALPIFFLWFYSVFAVIPQPFDLQSPANDYRYASLRPTVTWNAATNSAAYKVQVCTNNWWTTDLVVNKDSVKVLNYTVPTDLVNKTKYYWRIIAYGTLDDESTKRICNQDSLVFTTESSGIIFQGPDSTTLTSSPHYGGSLTSTTMCLSPTLAWAPVTGSYEYLLQVSTTQLFTSFVYNSIISNTNVTLSNTSLAFGKWYFWRVAAINGFADTSSWSTGNGSYFITQPQGSTVISAPSLSSPADGATIPNVYTFTCSSVSNAEYYFFEFSDNASFTPILASENSMTPTTSVTMSLTTGIKYFWRAWVKASSTFSPVSTVRSLTTITPAYPYYPIESQNMISCAFGPRNVSGVNWFHGAIDVAQSQNSPTVNVNAPCDCRVIYCNRGNLGAGADYIDFVNTETNGNPKSFRLQHVVIPPLNVLDIDTTFNRGDVICTQLELYQNNGYHVHVNAWDYTIGRNITGSEKGIGSPGAVNPLKYWQHSTGNYSYSNVGPSSTGTWPTDPNVGGLRYFYFTITCPRTDFMLNRIVLQIMDANSTDITANFLVNPDAAIVDFTNGGSSFNKSANGVSDTWSGIAGNYNDDAATTGVKILCKDLTTTSDKVYLFRYYIKATAPNPTYFLAQLYDANGATGGNRLPSISNDLPQTPVGKTSPPPPNTITVSQITNGLQIAWANIPSNNPPADYWGVYRKTAGSTESPMLIGMTCGTSFQDRTDIVTNTINPGTTYSYTVAGTNILGQGPLGAWINGTMTSLPNDFVFENRVVMTSEPELKAKNSITVKSVQILSTGAKQFTAGAIINLNASVDVSNGATANYNINPSVK